MYEIHLIRDIDAPQALVWEVITDASSYGDWNTFITACESSFEVGTPIRMKVNFGTSERMQTEYITANEPMRLIEYGMKPIPVLLSSRRQHRLAQIDDQTCRYESWFQLKGFVSPLVWAALGKNMQRGFEQMTDGIKSRAEWLLNNR